MIGGISWNPSDNARSVRKEYLGPVGAYWTMHDFCMTLVIRPGAVRSHRRKRRRHLHAPARGSPVRD